MAMEVDSLRQFGGRGVVEADIIAAILEFFKTGKLLRTLSKTNVVLIPKTDVPRTTNDYMPIACCGVVYKCIAKMLCERLNLGFPKLIDANRAAFVESRSIIHKVLIGQELGHLYRRHNVSPGVMMKIDIKKAYDSVGDSYMNSCLG